MRSVSFTLLFSMLFFCSWNLHSQLVLNAEIRPRFELRDGYKTLPSEDDKIAASTVQRNRLGMNFKNSQIETRVSFQNVLVWGSEPLKTNLSSVGLHEAWIKVKIGDSLYIKSGRQEISYDDRRMISNSDWNHVGFRHDLLLIQLFRDTWRLDAGFAFNQESEKLFGTEYTLQGNYKFMNFIYYSGKLGENGKISLLSLTDGFQSLYTNDQTNFRFTNGGTYLYKIPAFDFFTAGFFQTGTNVNDSKISAWYTHFNAGVSVNSYLRFETGIEVFSGNDFNQQGENKIRAFDVAYGSGHGFNGTMDYFTAPSHTRGTGLVNPYITFIWSLNTLNQFRADVHVFSLQNNYVHLDNIIDKYLGTEIDLFFRRNISKEIYLSLGYSVMFAAKSMEIIKGGSSNRPAHWGFFTFCYKPEFLFNK